MFSYADWNSWTRCQFFTHAGLVGMRLSGFNDGIQEAGAGLELCQEIVLTGWFKVSLSENRIPLNPYTQWPIQVPKISYCVIFQAIFWVDIPLQWDFPILPLWRLLNKCSFQFSFDVSRTLKAQNLGSHGATTCDFPKQKWPWLEQPSG